MLIAEEALKIAPSSTWASHAVLGFRCAQGDWDGALKILDNDLDSGLIDKATYRRRRGVLLTARALELEKLDRDMSRESAMEAVKLAPTLVPAAVLAAKFESEAHQVRRAMRIVEAAWLAHPHPDLADAYAHVRLGDSARQRLVRVETLAAKTPGHIEGALAIARAAIDAAEFARAREALAPFIAAPTQRVAMLMAEIERTEHGDSGRARAWTLRAVRARHDPVWTADGYVSDRWRPVSPVTGRLDAFQWQTPVASLPSDKGATIESSPFEEAMLAAPAPRRERLGNEGLAEPPREALPVVTPEPATQDNSPPAPDAAPKMEPKTEPKTESKSEKPEPNAVAKTAPEPIEPAAARAAPAAKAVDKAVEKAVDNRVDKSAEPVSLPAPAATAPQPSPPTESLPPATPAPLFRTRADLGKPAGVLVPTVIPILRAPDDPGIDDEAPGDEFAEKIGTPRTQAGGWRGFWSRLGG